MPFEARFWETARHIKETAGKLDQIKGFITALPVNWTGGENIHFDYSSALLVNNEVKDPSPSEAQPSTQVVKADSKNRPGEIG